MTVQSAILDDTACPGLARSCVLRAETIGCRAPRQWQSGRVVAVFACACYVAIDGGGLLAILTRDAGLVAHGIRLESRPRLDTRLHAGLHVRCDGNRISFAGKDAAIDVSRAKIWQPKLQSGVFDRSPRARQSLACAEELLAGAAARSDSEFLKAVLQIAVPPSAFSDLISVRLLSLAAAQQARDSAATLKAIGGLIGLGPGLTPAGDDFVIGFIAGLTLSAESAEARRFRQEMCEGVAALRHATTMISAQHLDDACHLCFSERLTNLCDAIGRGRSEADLQSQIAAQLSVGATSGADAASGLIFALSAVAACDR